jgi:hypothetical protein
MSSSHEDDPPSHGLTGLAGRVLGYMDRPWKAVAVIVLLVLLGFGFIAWEERALLLQPLRMPGKASLKLDALQRSASNLLQETNADVVTIWAFDVESNTQSYLVARTRGGAPWDFAPKSLPAITSAIRSEEVVKLLRGTPICDDPADRGALLMKYLAASGMHRVCIVPVPPTPELVLAGLYVAWRTPPEPRLEEAAVGAAIRTATDIVRR